MANQISTFKRSFSDDLINKLKTQTLYHLLLADIQKGFVFPCIREDRIDFYYKGGKLFQYDRSGFKTHIKYASVIERKNKDYLTQDELKTSMLISDFAKGYARIRENCKNFSGVEGTGVSDIFKKHSYIVKASGVIMLDIEVAMRSNDPNRNFDRIDILLYNRDEKKLKFVEAKHFSNPELWATTQTNVANQIKRYEGLIISKEKEIISGYNTYIEIVNKLFGAGLHLAQEVDKSVALLIFGFDKAQLQSRVKQFVYDNKNLKGINTYAIGNVGKIVLDNL